VDAGHVFESAEAFLNAPRFADIVFICTPDRTHFQLCQLIAKAGYDIVLEKPIATTLSECVALCDIQRRYGNGIFVAHVLRYSPIFLAVKEILDEGSLGAIRHIRLIENVGHWHFEHSFVRGPWRRVDESGPIVLTKTSHDLDILQWLMGESVRSVTSHGSLSYFRPENAPIGATPKCVDCPRQSDCTYSATRFYMEPRPVWPYDVPLGGGVDTLAARRSAIQEGPYGRCVWLSDNDVCDDQVVLLEFDTGRMATFEMHANTVENTRELTVLCDHGEISANVCQDHLVVSRFTGQPDNIIREPIDLPRFGDSHGGGDLNMLLALHEHLTAGKHVDLVTSLESSLNSHVLAFLAEQSRNEDNAKMLVAEMLVPQGVVAPETGAGGERLTA
jgi:hypothetical protein